jgi:hypothetical protein
MAKGRYIIDSTGNELTDSKSGEKIRIKSYEIKRSGKFQIVHVIDGHDKARKFARHSINEEKFNLGVVTASKEVTLRDVSERAAAAAQRLASGAPVATGPSAVEKGNRIPPAEGAKNQHEGR